jgi:hypothetical protein
MRTAAVLTTALLGLAACSATPGPQVAEAPDACAARIDAAGGDARTLATSARGAAIAARTATECASSPARERVSPAALDATLAAWVSADAAACDAITTAALASYGRAAEVRHNTTPAPDVAPPPPGVGRRPAEQDVITALDAMRPGLELTDAAIRLCPTAAWLPSLRARAQAEMTEHTNFSLLAAQNTDILATSVLDMNEAAKNLAADPEKTATTACPVMAKGLEAFTSRPHFTFQSDGRLDLFKAADAACKAGPEALQRWGASYADQINCVPMIGRIRTGVPFALERAAQGDVIGACQSIIGARSAARIACATTPQRLEIARPDLDRMVGLCGWKSAWE